MKPAVGLLTSTARTFIQEGVTTEYATQVLGTTLDHGRLYAQLLTKSSRVLYHNDNAASSVEPANPINPTQSTIVQYVRASQYPQNTHNDNNVDSNEWHVLANGGDHDDDNIVTFIKNTDYISPSNPSKAFVVYPSAAAVTTKLVAVSTNSQQEQIEFLPESLAQIQEKPIVKESFSVSKSSSSSSSGSGSGNDDNANGNAVQIAADKVKSNLDLPTFTVKNEFAPSGLSWDGNESDALAKLTSVEDNSDSVDDNEQKITITASTEQQNRVGKKLYNLEDDLRHLTSVTYYGFADFTTIVGNTVIIFSPNTAAPAVTGQITSIKGQATLHEEIKPTTTVTTIERIQPTRIVTADKLGFLQKNKLKSSSNNAANLPPNIIRNGKADSEIEQTTVSDESEESTTVDADETTETVQADNQQMEEKRIEKLSKNKLANSIITIEPSEVSIATPTLATPLLSIPSNEDIARIFASLAAKVDSDSSDIVQSIETTATNVANSPDEENETRVLGGVTTIFFEDDPFATLESSTINSVESISATSVSEATIEPTVEVISTTTEHSKHENEDDTPETTPETTDATTISGNEDIFDETTIESDTSVERATTEAIDDIIETSTTEKKGNECANGFVLKPSTIYKTLTYLTTFFIPTDDEETTTTSIESNRVTATDVQYECSRTKAIEIAPSATIEESQATATQIANVAANDQDNLSKDKKKVPIHRPFKPIKFLKSTTTTTTTTTTEPPTEQPTEESVENDTTTELAAATESAETQQPETVTDADGQEDDDEIELIYKTLYTTYTYLTTFFHESTSSVSSRKEVVTNIVTSTLDLAAVADLFGSAPTVVPETIQPTNIGIGRPTTAYPITEKEHINIGDIFDEGAIISNLHQATPVLNSNYQSGEIKTYFTTYTYFTTIFVDGETEISSRTEVYTNYVGQSIKPTKLVEEDRTFLADASIADSNVNNVEQLVENRSDAIGSDEVLDNNVIQPSYSTMLRGSDSTVRVAASDSNAEYVEESKMSTEMKSSSSDGDSQILESSDTPKIAILEDQISSESNKEEIIPSPTLLLQTSYTTFTYFTTMYHGSTSSDILSRLETITNVVTETLHPTQLARPADETVDPVTYFTTFTYWTTLYKEGEITTTSREEIVSNVVQPTAAIKDADASANAITVTIVPNIVEKEALNTQSSLAEVSVRSGKEGNLDAVTVTPVYPSNSDNSDAIEATATASPDNEPTTYYTTYTYFTTSYIGDDTVLNSRFETVTNVIPPTSSNSLGSGAIGRAINLDKNSPNQLVTEKQEKKVKLNVVNEAPVKPAASDHIVSINQGKIVDAEGISTILYTTQVLETKDANDQYSLITQSASSIKVDEIKKLASIEKAGGENAPSGKHHKTGLVRQIDGTIVANHTTTVYQSKVIGTVIDNRYAQIIESTSSFIIDKTSEPSIAPTKLLQAIRSTALPINPTPAVIESSIGDATQSGEENDNDGEQEGDEEGDLDEDGEDEYDANGRKKSRLSFASRKRTFTPVIRPFASRNRPTFNPKRKNSNPSSATIITRSDFTPTITATPAIKSEGSTRARFGNGARRTSSNVPTGPLPSAQPSGSRRFSRPRTSSAVASSIASTNAGPSSTRIRSSSLRATASIVAGPSSSRRSGNLFRPSSSLGGSRLSILPSQSRFRINPTSTLTKQLASATPKAAEPIYDDQTTAPGSNDPINTTDANEDDEEDESGITTTENSRRNANPLLRFRRPPGARFSPSSTARSPTATVSIATRRNPISQRKANALTTTTTTTTPKPKSRAFQRPPAISTFTNRPRAAGASNNLFPPRGLFRPNAANQDLDKEENNNITSDGNHGEDDEEITDDDIDTKATGDGADESAADEEAETENSKDVRERRENKSYGSNSPLAALLRKRTKRQVDYGTRNGQYNSRYRRPQPQQPQPQIAQRSYDDYDQVEDIEYSTQRPKIASRYTSRQRPAPINQVNNSNNNIGNTSNRIRPTTASRAQFTLRNEKENVYTPPARSSNFRRQPTTNSYSSAARRKPLPTSAARSKTSRHRNYGGYAPTDARNSRTRAGTTLTNTRPRTTVRSRSRLGYDNNDYSLEPSFNAMITVTHHVPTEVTIPVISGQVTEYKNVITAKVSTEVLGPNDYSTSVRPNGVNVLVLTNAITNVNQNNGATEITQYVLKETSTSSIQFTPTTIRGRKTSFSHVVPSTVYNVEPVVSTIQPNIAANAPLANILLSQLLLGNLNLGNQQAQNPLLGLAAAQQQQQPGVPGTPTTEFKIRTTSYVTTVTNAMSTVIPITFRGAKILTTIVDSSVDVITATEFITDTIVVTPTAVAQPQQFNSLLLPLLLQQQQQQQAQTQVPNLSNIDPNIAQSLLQDTLLTQDSDNQAFTGNKRINPTDIDDNHDIQEDVYEEDDEQLEDQSEENIQKLPLPSKIAQNTSKRKNNKPIAPKPAFDTSVITLYVSGKRPGEFSTVLSTVTQSIGSDSTQLHKRAADLERNGYHLINVRASNSPILEDFYRAEGSDIEEYILPGADYNTLESSLNDNKHDADLFETESLESIIGDVSEYLRTSSIYQASYRSTANLESATVHDATLNTNYDDTNIHVKSNKKGKQKPFLY